MLNIFSKSTSIYIKTIDKAKLPMLYGIYKETEPFLCKTREERVLDFNDFVKIFTESARASNSFFVGIFQTSDDRLVGFVKGRVQQSLYNVWINIIALGYKYRCKGYGTDALKLLHDVAILKGKVENVYLAVRSDNIDGINFWLSKKFEIISEDISSYMTKDATKDEGALKVFIMKRNLKK